MAAQCAACYGQAFPLRVYHRLTKSLPHESHVPLLGVVKRPQSGTECCYATCRTLLSLLNVPPDRYFQGARRTRSQTRYLSMASTGAPPAPPDHTHQAILATARGSTPRFHLMQSSDSANPDVVPDSQASINEDSCTSEQLMPSASAESPTGSSRRLRKKAKGISRHDCCPYKAQGVHRTRHDSSGTGAIHCSTDDDSQPVLSDQGGCQKTTTFAGGLLPLKTLWAFPREHPGRKRCVTPSFRSLMCPMLSIMSTEWYDTGCCIADSSLPSMQQPRPQRITREFALPRARSRDAALKTDIHRGRATGQLPGGITWRLSWKGLHTIIFESWRHCLTQFASPQ